MNWLIEIFTSNSDKARLITTLLAAVIAVMVVLLNQSFNSKRAKKEKLINKLEEMYSVIIKMQTLKTTMYDEIIRYIHKEDERRRLFEIHDELETVGARAYMLSGLYFSEISDSLAKLTNEHDYLHNAFVESNTPVEYLKASKEHIDNLDVIYLKLYSELSEIMKKIMH